MAEEEDDRPAGRRGWRLAAMLMRAAASASETIASTGQELSQSIEEGANHAVDLGVRQVEGVLRDIERKVSDFQRRQRELAAQAAEDQRRQPVDLQVGDSVFEDMPAEMRSRLYCVIARQPELVENLKGRLLRCLSSCKDSGSPRHLRGQRRSSAAGQHSSSSLGSTGQSPHHRLRRQQLDLMQAQQQRAVSRLAVEGLGRSVSSGSCPHPAPQSVGSDGESGDASGSDVAAAGSSSRVSAHLDAARASQAALFEAMHHVPWASGGSVPDEAPDGGYSEYAALLAAPRGSALQRCMGGLESVDDIIGRDLGRTFPEHPLFMEGDGQARLGRLLRAYALRDPETGYCQGMAFGAGLLLTLVPEETAFTLYCRLMDEPPAGAGLRRLYAPGLEPLKLELATFELLLGERLPELHAHLATVGAVPLLYASPWFLTLYAATPMPLQFSARVLDVLLQSGCDGVLPRVALALLQALQADLLAHPDFEGVITALKVAPLSWPPHTFRAVLDTALSPGFVSDAQLALARDAVAVEAARVVRPPASFTMQRRVMRTESDVARFEAEVLQHRGGATSFGVSAPSDARSDHTASVRLEGLGARLGSGGVASCPLSRTTTPSGSLALGAAASLANLSEIGELETLLSELHLIPGGSGSEHLQQPEAPQQQEAQDGPAAQEHSLEQQPDQQPQPEEQQPQDHPTAAQSRQRQSLTDILFDSFKFF